METLWIIGGVGAGVLLLSLFFDGVFDSLHLDIDGVPVVTTLSAFAAVFGICGALMMSSGMSVTAALVTGVLVAVGAALVIVVSYRALKRNADANRDAETDELVGQIATVTTWGVSGGEVLATWAGSTRKLRAVCPEQVQVGQEVEIIEIVGNNVVKVRTFR